jgi:hypothetical protein
MYMKNLVKSRETEDPNQEEGEPHQLLARGAAHTMGSFQGQNLLIKRNNSTKYL